MPRPSADEVEGAMSAPASQASEASEASEVLTVLLAEDHEVVRQGLKMLLESERDIRVVGQAENGRQAVELAQQLDPSVIVMDVSMPQLNGLEATRQILKASPAARVILLSAHGETAYVDQAVSFGARGYLLKQASLEALSKAIREVRAGRMFFGPSVQPSLPTDEAGRRKPVLTVREAEVLQLVAEGRANKQIAAELDISIKTVEKHRQHVMEKLGIHDTAGLTRYALANGIVN
jgi:DNA-binding NarL/FixJ family response regulator